MKLSIELVPRTVWFKNLRSELQGGEWDLIRKAVYKRACYVCEMCGGTGEEWPVECHEVWNYNDTKKTQTLTGLVALCPSCHEVKHIGLATVKGRQKIAVEHLAKVNGITIQCARSYLSVAISTYKERSQHDWELDLSWIHEFKNGL